MEHTIDFIGLDGGNPLGFLAALGAFRTLHRAWPDAGLKMSWQPLGAWRPRLHAARPLDRAEIVAALDQQLAAMREHPAFALADNLNVSPKQFREYAQAAQSAALTGHRRWADFAAAFACEATTETDSKKQPIVQDTELRTMSGAGHQHFLGSIRYIAAQTGPEHIDKALFEPWHYDDAMEKQTMRWDPMDDVRYALRWRNPSGDPTRKKQGAVLGANRLAIEGLPLLPVMPTGRRLRTTGFRGRGSRDTFWTWPIWGRALGLDPIRSAIALRQLQEDAPPRHELAAMGIVEIFRSQRLTVGKFRNFTAGNTV